MADDWTMGALAAQDAYQPVDNPWLPDVGAPAIGSGGQFSPGVPAVNNFIGSLLAPRQRDPNSPVEYRTASPLVNITTQDIADATDKAMAFSGGGLGIKAYHSSPHDFERFDASKIGTGEGAQVYGHGLYFAENPAVSGQGGQYWNQFLNRFGESPERHAAEKLRNAKFDRETALNDSKWNLDQIKDYVAHGNPQTYEEVQRWHYYNDKLLPMRQAEHDLLASGNPVGPRTYEVDINADPAHMLDWDKRLGEQSPMVQQGLAEKFGITPSLTSRWGQPLDPTGSQIYHEFADTAGKRNMSLSQAEMRASAQLNQAGIPGIKYLDQGSRLAGDWHLTPPDQTVSGKWMVKNRDYNSKGMHFDTEEAAHAALAEKLAQRTSNYVVFNPGIIDIMKKYGLAGAAPVGLGALAAQDSYRGD